MLVAGCTILDTGYWIVLVLDCRAVASERRPVLVLEQSLPFLVLHFESRLPIPILHRSITPNLGRSRTRTRTRTIKHPASSIQHPESSIVHPASPPDSQTPNS